MDYAQRDEDTSRIASGDKVPVVYFTQLIAVALDLDHEVWGMVGHYVDPEKHLSIVPAAN
jgi:hypothetical protein